MRGLAGLDRLLDSRQHGRRERKAPPPVMLEKMPDDACNAHVYQLPDAPPPPKLPPPPLKPPLSLPLELEPLPDQEPPLPPMTHPPESR